MEASDLVEVEVGTSKKLTSEDGDFSVNTKGGCFICFKVADEDDEDRGGSLSLSSIQDLYKYLKINWRRIWGDFSPSKIIPPQDRPLEDNIGELKVTLCSDCTFKLDNFKRLLAELEDIKRKVDSSLQLVVDTMENVEKDDNGYNPSSNEEFWRRMRMDEMQTHNDDGTQLELVRKLRERAIGKVSSAKGEDGLFQGSKLKKCQVVVPKKSKSSTPQQGTLKRSTSPSDLPDKSCRVCSRKFKSEFSLRRHIFVHLAGVLPYKCPHCPNEFQVKSMLEAHLRRTHVNVNLDIQGAQSGGGRTTVIVTQMKSGDAQTKEVHMERHQSDDDNEEEEEDQEATSMEPQPRPKIRREAPPPSLPPRVDTSTRCRFCKRPFITVAGLKRHYERSHKTRQGNVLLIPMETTDGGRKTVEYPCPLCEHKFPGEISLREHRKICPVRECPICFQKFRSGHALSNHMQDEHAGRKERRNLLFT